MKIELPELPWAKNALAPYISEETIEYHYGKHHATYVNKLNDLIQGHEYEHMSLEDIVRKAGGGVFNNAAQTWNHTFYWNSMSPDGGGEPFGLIADAIQKSFGSFDVFKSKFTDAAVGLFGSGWVWLAIAPSGGLEILPMSNADTPLRLDSKPVLTLDVWEHAYYIDHRNARPKFVEGFWDVVNWDHANRVLQG